MDRQERLSYRQRQSKLMLKPKKLGTKNSWYSMTMTPIFQIWLKINLCRRNNIHRCFNIISIYTITAACAGLKVKIKMLSRLIVHAFWPRTLLMLGVAICHQSYTIFAIDFGTSFNIFLIEMKWLRKIQTFSFSINKNVSQECALMHHVANKPARIGLAL